ncbi:MAG: glycosyltransferase family 2 protein, partial [Planctomycetota bacterium]
IVDNATKDSTLTDILPLFDSFSEKGIGINVVRCESRGNKCLARNMGAEAAKGEILIFMDDDTVLTTNDALGFISKNLQRNQFACGAKRYWTVLYWDSQKALAESKTDGFGYLRSVAHLPRGIKRGSGMRDLMEFTWIACFGAIYKDDFDEVGGFDINYSGWGRHDMDLMLRLLVGGFSFVNLFDRISVIHLNHRVIRQDLQKKHQNISYYLEKERNLGFAFKPNLLFGVYEGDGKEILVGKKED